jgi:UDP-glucose 4-epimerase
MQKRILVTGASGFIGRHVFEMFDGALNHGDRLLGVSRNTKLDFRHLSNGTEPTPQTMLTRVDVSEEKDVSTVIAFFEPTHIVHLAANPLIKAPAQELLNSNLMGTYYLLKYAPQGCRFVFASSATVYGDLGSKFACTEDDVCVPTSVYGICKLGSEVLIREFSRAGKVNGAILRLVANVGKGSAHGLVHDIIRKLKSDSPELELIGEGPGSCKPLMHVEDTARAITYFTTGNGWGDVVNICPKDNITVERVAETAMEVTGIKKPIKWLGWASNWKGDNTKLLVSNSYAWEHYGFNPQYPLSEMALRQALKDMEGK